MGQRDDVMTAAVVSTLCMMRRCQATATTSATVRRHCHLRGAGCVRPAGGTRRPRSARAHAHARRGGAARCAGVVALQRRVRCVRGHAEGVLGFHRH